MKKLLVIGGSHSDMPLINSGILHGLKIFTTGNRPDHPGHHLSSGYIPGDFSDPEEILDVTRRIGADYIVSGANDFAMLSAAYVAEQLKLPGYDSFATTTLLHRKDQFKAFAASIGMPVCRHVTLNANDLTKIESQTKGLHYPLIIKPVDLTGGKGISRIDDPNQLASAIKYAVLMSYQNMIIAEEWFEGSLHSYSTIIENGEIIFEYFDSEFCEFNDFLVSTSLSICSILSEAKEIIRIATRRMINELRLVDGVLHCQFLASDHDAKIIEFTRRMSGDLYSRVVHFVCGFRHEDVFIASALGRPLSRILKPTQVVHPYVSRYCITSTENGLFSHLDVSEDLRSHVESITLVTPFGSVVNDDGRSKVAVAIMIFSNETEMTNYSKNYKFDFHCRVIK